MEYCITILVERFAAEEHFSVPSAVDSAWGPAVRGEEEGRLYYTSDLFVRRVPAIAHLVRRLPVSSRDLPWISLAVAGDALRDFERCVNQPAAVGEDGVAHHPLLRMVGALLRPEPRWVICLEYGCDRIAAVRYNQTLLDALAAIVEAYRWDSDSPRGVCCTSGS